MSLATVIQPGGIFDGTQTSEFRCNINESIEAGAKVILVDLQDVTFMDSSGLGTLVVALKAVRAKGGKMFLCSVNDQVKMLFELTSMGSVFKIFADRKAFENRYLQQINQPL